MADTRSSVRFALYFHFVHSSRVKPDSGPDLARETSVNQHVALKILTADSYYGVGKSVYELAILQHISKVDQRHAGYKHVIHLLDHFTHTGPHGEHLCLVFKVMGESVGALRRRFPTRQVPAALWKRIARQVLLGLDYLHQSCGVIHTGLWLVVLPF
jgi:serine/threonine-protein kinase SRPK3